MSDLADAARSRRELMALVQDLGLRDPTWRALATERLWQLAGSGTDDPASAAERALVRWVSEATGLDLGGGFAAFSRAVAALLLSDALERWPEHFLAPRDGLPAALCQALAEATPLAQPQPLPGIMPEQRLEVLAPEPMRLRPAPIGVRRG